MNQIAALYVETDGCYFGLDGVDPWDIKRDAQTYSGPHPVVAHPPCNRWSMLANVVQAVHGYRVGADNGMFYHAMRTVQRFGGVLEHPASTIAWRRYGLPRPSPGVWTSSLFDDGYVAEVNQAHYGHPASKPTWLYAVGCELPKLRHGKLPTVTHRVGNLTLKSSEARNALRLLRGNAASATPPEFQELLINMARSARRGK